MRSCLQKDANKHRSHFPPFFLMKLIFFVFLLVCFFFQYFFFDKSGSVLNIKRPNHLKMF